MLLILFVALVACDNWAILVAGSNTYSNYRHQADVCQSFQQLKQAGIPEEKIIVWMYDDIANNPSNPHKGSIVNYVGGPDVYPGVPKDYTGKDVIPTNFLKLLHGEDMKIGSGKSLKSTAEDNVFIYFTDHGGPGIICFPGFIELHVADLMEALEYMYTNKMYKELVFYLEACESGSMFDGHLKAEWNMYGVTASDPHQSSWACDHSSDYNAYLNDCWSRNYMNDTRWAITNKAMATRTYKEQFDWVKEQTTQSPECGYGDMDIQAETLDKFQGGAAFNMPLGRRTQGVGVVAYDVVLRTLEFAVRDEKNAERRAALEIELEDYKLHRYKMDLRWSGFAKVTGVSMERQVANGCTGRQVIPKCMKEMVIAAKRQCGSFDNYSFKYYYLLDNACHEGLSVSDVEATLKDICYIV